MSERGIDQEKLIIDTIFITVGVFAIIGMIVTASWILAWPIWQRILFHFVSH